MPTQSIIDQVIAAKSKGRNRLHNILTSDVAERLKIRRKAIAKDVGLENDYDVGTYPPVIPESATNIIQKGIGAAGMVLGMVTAGGLVAGGVMLSEFLKDDKKPETKVIDNSTREGVKIHPLIVKPPTE